MQAFPTMKAKLKPFKLSGIGFNMLVGLLFSSGCFSTISSLKQQDAYQAINLVIERYNESIDKLKKVEDILVKDIPSLDLSQIDDKVIKQCEAAKDAFSEAKLTIEDALRLATRAKEKLGAIKDEEAKFKLESITTNLEDFKAFVDCMENLCKNPTSLAQFLCSAKGIKDKFDNFINNPLGVLSSVAGAGMNWLNQCWSAFTSTSAQAD